jgi:uncharacterized membrane protein
MMELLIKLLITGAAMGLLDFIWLGYLAKKIYYSQMGELLLAKPNMIPALLFYVIYVVGVIVFVVDPSLAKGSLAYAAGYGALFGLVAYATYDLTSLSVVKGFSAKVVIIDIIWGVLLTMTVASLAFLGVSTWIS